MSIDVDIVPSRRNSGLERSHVGRSTLPTNGSKEVGLNNNFLQHKLSANYLDEKD